MKILHTVEYYYPSVGGMQEVVRQLSERLVRLGHDVTVATTFLHNRQSLCHNGVNIAQFAVEGNMVRGMTGEIDRYRRFVTDSDYDIIVNFAAQQWATDAVITMLADIRSKKVFVPTGFSGLYSSQYVDYFDKMKIWLKQYDINVFLSNDYRDINFARANGITNTTLIPNGAGEDEFLSRSTIDIRKALSIPEGTRILLHVGSHTGVKGHYEAIEIFRRAKITHAVLLIVGDEPINGCSSSCRDSAQKLNKSLSFRRADKSIIIKKISREGTVAAFKSADIFLFPSNIECSPIVLFECMASRTPFLVTDVGNSKEIVTWSNSGLVLPTLTHQVYRSFTDRCKKIVRDLFIMIGMRKRSLVENFVASTADIYSSTRILESIFYDKERLNVMAESGYSAWQDRFTWEKIAMEYESLYYSLLKGTAHHENT